MTGLTIESSPLYIFKLEYCLTIIMRPLTYFSKYIMTFFQNKIKQVLYITVGAMVESSVSLHYVHLSFSDDWFDNRK